MGRLLLYLEIKWGKIGTEKQQCSGIEWGNMGLVKLEIGELIYKKFELSKAKTTSGFITTCLLDWLIGGCKSKMTTIRFWIIKSSLRVYGWFRRRESCGGSISADSARLRAARLRPINERSFSLCSLTAQSNLRPDTEL